MERPPLIKTDFVIKSYQIYITRIYTHSSSWDKKNLIQNVVVGLDFIYFIYFIYNIQKYWTRKKY